MLERAGANRTSEFDVGRLVSNLLRLYFTLEKGWSIVPEFQVPEGKKPDFVLEKLSNGKLVPKIFVEVKRMGGESTHVATEQVTKTPAMTVDNSNLTAYAIVVTGRTIDFYEYHNYRDMLPDNIPQHSGAIPFNSPIFKDNRPKYPGYLQFSAKGDEDWQPQGRQRDEWVGCDLNSQPEEVQAVLMWMAEKGAPEQISQEMLD